MFIVFNPIRLLVATVVCGAIGLWLANVGVYHSQGPHPMWMIVFAGALMCAVAAFCAATLTVYILRGMWLFFSAPWRR